MRERGVGHDAPTSEPGVEARDSDRAVGRRAWGRDVLGMAWTVAAAALVLLPALRPGVSLGPFDLFGSVSV